MVIGGQEISRTAETLLSHQRRSSSTVPFAIRAAKVFVHVGYHPYCRRVVAPLLISTENLNFPHAEHITGAASHLGPMGPMMYTCRADV